MRRPTRGVAGEVVAAFMRDVAGGGALFAYVKRNPAQSAWLEARMCGDPICAALAIEVPILI